VKAAPRSVRRHVVTLTVVGLAAAMVAPVRGVAAPDPAPPIEVVDASHNGCELDGVQSLCDGFYWGSADAEFGALGAGQDGVQLDLSADFDSIFFLDVAQQQVTGEWKIDGLWKMVFSGSSAGTPINGEARVTSRGGGIAEGTASSFSVSGTETNEGVADFGVFTQPISNSGPLQPVEVVVTGGNCVEATGEWRMSWGALASEIGWNGTDTITGGFTALRQDQYDRDVVNDLTDRAYQGEDVSAELDAAPLPDLVKQIAKATVVANELRVTIGLGEDPVGDIFISNYLDVLEAFERIAAEAKNAAACEREILGDTLQAITGYPARIAAEIAKIVARDNAEVSGSVILQATEAAIRTGVLGEGSTLSAAEQSAIADGLRAKIELALEATVSADDFSTIDGASKRSEFDAARAALLLGGEYTVHGRGANVNENWVENASPGLDAESWRDIILGPPKSLTLDLEDE